MNALMYLFFTKIKASIRNVFRKPLSAILTLAALTFFAFILFVALTSENVSMAGKISSVEDMIMMLLAYIAFMLGIMLLQKRTALVRIDDAFYIFVGPFTRSQILSYITIDSIKGSALYALIAVFYVIMLMSHMGLTAGFILFLIFITCVLFYIIFAFITYLYLMEITNPNIKKTKVILFIVIISIILLLYAKNLLETQFDPMNAFQQFMHDPTFFVIPLFGWMKWAVVSMALGNYLNLTIATALLLLCSAGVTALILSVKGDFYEKAVEDASWYSDLRKGLKEGKQANINLKIKQVDKVNFMEGARAILSKNVLELRKTKSWLRKQDLFLMLFYLLLAKLMGMDFMFYQYYILIVLATSVNTDFVISELKKHYIYLIPEKPMTKIIYLLLPVIARLFVLIVMGLIPSWFVYRVEAWAFASAIVNLIGYALIFVGSNVWSLKVMKTRNNVLVEQFLKMLVILIAIIPAAVVTVLVYLFVPLTEMQVVTVASISSMIVNIIVGVLFILNAKSMLHGTSLMAD